jgi:hypothetical protein
LSKPRILRSIAINKEKGGLSMASNIETIIATGTEL